MADRTFPKLTTCGDRPVVLEDVVSAFAVYLGRKMDHPDQANAWLGMRLADMLGAFVTSPEFMNKINDLIANRQLGDPGALSATESARADRWLAGLSSDHRPSAGAQWGDLLWAALGTRELADLAGHTVDPAALELLGAQAEERRLMRAPLVELTNFDVDAFLTTEAGRRYRSAAGGVDFDARIPSGSVRPVVLPLFTDGLDAVGPAGPVTLGDWVAETQVAAMSGALTHWLWNEPTYLRNRIAKAVRLGEMTSVSGAYLDFLTTGDAAGVSPHPLFCHYAYRALNADLPSTLRAGFRHFATDGAATGLRTSALFDPDFYLAHQPQVRRLIATGAVGSAIEHFVKLGLAAGHAFSPDFDRAYYLGRYPDVALTIDEGGVPSAEWHYVFFGAGEGRAPNPFFDPLYYAVRYPFVGEEMRRLGIATTIEHFLLLGQKRGAWASQPPVERSVALSDGKSLFEKRARRAREELLDGAVTLPAAIRPHLSVVVPVSGQGDFTAGVLRSAAFAAETLLARRGMETEIIVVDNGSSDHTQSLLAALASVKVARFEHAMGFPAAVNAGAEMAQGEILLIMNNDIEFAPDAFDRLVRVLDENPQVGVVGAKVILPNETIQEVGAILDRLGSSHGLGRDADAARVHGARQVEVDYVSGCFMACPRADFQTLGGFDETFSPGYFEDVDFALRMKLRLGKTTVVDTGLTVTHYEHASFAKGRPPSVNDDLILRNRQRLKLAHPSVFQGLGTGGARQRNRLARQALAGGHRVLLVCDQIPSSNPESGFRRQDMILDALSKRGVPFDIAVLSPTPHVDVYKAPRAAVFRNWMPDQSLASVLREQGGDYSHLWISGTEILSAYAGEISRARSESDLAVICDVQHLPGREASERMRSRGQAADEADRLSMVTGDLTAAMNVDLWVTSTARDRALIERVGLGPVADLGDAARSSADLRPERPFEDRNLILFAGTVNRYDDAGYAGLEWFLGNVWPLLPEDQHLRLTVIGTWPDDLSAPFLERFGNAIDFRGEVDPALRRNLYDQSRVVVAPSRFATAQSMAILDAAAAGVPVVITDTSAQEFDLEGDGTFALGIREDDGGTFAGTLIKLFTDPKAWQRQIVRQRTALASRFDVAHFVGTVASILETVHPSDVQGRISGAPAETAHKTIENHAPSKRKRRPNP